MRGGFYLLNVIILLTVRFARWAFFEAWPVGLGLITGYLLSEFMGGNTTVWWIGLVAGIAGGYAWKHRDILFGNKDDNV